MINLSKSLFTLLAIASLSGDLNAETALKGQWLTDLEGQTLLDPQTSGVTFRKGELVVIGDQSAHESTRMKLFRIDPATGASVTQPIQITVAESLKNSCFYGYLSDKPDFEALTWDRIDETSLITVTEDASAYELSPECKKRFSQTNSTSYPSLLLKIQVDNALTRAEIVAVRPVQFPLEAKVGNYPNDGIEGLAVDDHQNLYLALEQDIANKPQLFKTRLTQDFWLRDNFVKVIDANLTFPVLDDKDHPINGIEFLPSPIKGHPGYLMAVARNDDELWVFDLTNRIPPFVQKLSFYVSTDDSGLCPAYEKLVQTALEAITIHDGTVYLINDPWKQHYTDNIQCGTHVDKFKRMSPLLFKMQADPRWFTPFRAKTQTSLPALSGLAALDQNRYLAVQDKKIQRQGDRLTLIQLNADQQLTAQSLFVTNWPAGQAANDLESVCALPDKNSEFLIAESGTWQGSFGRLFHIKVFPTYAQVLNTFELPVERDNSPEQDGDNFEGLACAKKDVNRYLVILGERGTATAAGFLQWGELDLAAANIQWNSQKIQVTGPTKLKNRHYNRVISDLHLEGDVLWASAVLDSSDNGPFASAVYPLALVTPNSKQPISLMAERPVLWQVDGFKVEGLASPSPLVPGSALMMVTDDENYHGQFRPLAITEQSPYGNPSPKPATTQ
ncbi:hypothetical protein Rhein_1930 [Rheinheimera sp. A13L]|uniref:hypothetical protein n=1 Tax=Rheinheimera sp. A13L TaxID=506534 RepID=UPI000212520A|nr:hypothetical protein [Rheinheimera sp. A13L]EGM77984.1 hypothetical protein Rhein_1930 [Rheinheimera sp. A13L]